MAPPLARRFRHLPADRRGAAAVEFALIAPVALAMMLGIIEFGFQMWTHVSLDYAVAQAARCRALAYVDATKGTDCSSLTGAKAYMQAVAVGISFPTGRLTVTNPASGCLAYSYTAAWLLPSLMPITAPTYTGTSCYYY